MGCDIYMYAEVRRKGAWQKVGRIFQHPYLSVGYGITDEVYIDRNYTLFALLAGVRNDDRLCPIAEPRGLPEDVTPEVAALADRLWEIAHGHSWFSVRELLNYDWQQTGQVTRVFEEDQYARFRKGLSYVCCIAITGPTVMVLSEEEYAALEPDMRDPLGHYVVRATWREPYMHRVGGFVQDTLPLVATLAAPEDVRLVFWFDN